MADTTTQTITASTGQRCPVSGVWRPIGHTETAPIAINNVMPPYKGKAVVWELLYKA